MCKLSMRLLLLVLILIGISLGGCATEEGTDPYAMWETYEHEDNFYAFSYLSPPWIFIDRQASDDRQLIAIEPRVDRIDFDIEEGNLNARIKAVVEMHRHRDASEVAANDAAEYRFYFGDAEVSEIEMFVSHQGASGVSFSAVLLEHRRLVAVYHEIRGDRVVSMKIVGNENLDTHDLTLLLKSLEPKSVDGE